VTKAGEVIRFPEIERVEEWKSIENVEADGGKPDFVQRRVAVGEGSEPSIEGVQLALSTIDFRF